MESHIKELKLVLENISMSDEDRMRLNDIFDKMQVAKTPQQKLELYKKWLGIFVTVSKIVHDVVKII